MDVKQAEDKIKEFVELVKKGQAPEVYRRLSAYNNENEQDIGALLSAALDYNMDEEISYRVDKPGRRAAQLVIVPLLLDKIPFCVSI